MSTVTQHTPFPKPLTHLVYRPRCYSMPQFWELRTPDGVRFTPDILTTEELLAWERRRNEAAKEHPEYLNIPRVYQYW
ncbi:MAG: hypothetical protein K1X50_10430 [Candidatus Promineofilum sp.]|nr:hypothetical protein [Promineifilum sp.]